MVDQTIVGISLLLILISANGIKVFEFNSGLWESKAILDTPLTNLENMEEFSICYRVKIAKFISKIYPLGYYKNSSTKAPEISPS